MIESADRSEAPEPVEPLRRGSRNRPRTDFFVHNITVTQEARNPQKLKQESRTIKENEKQK